MIGNLSVLAIIPARGGSKGLPGKNIKPLMGKPLIEYSIEAALGSQYVDRLICSTDDDKIAEVAKRAGCEVPFVRPAFLASDEATTIDVLLDVVRKIDLYDLVLLLQPTSPLRLADDVDRALELYVKAQPPSLVSVCLSEKNPEWMFYQNQDLSLRPVLGIQDIATRRQELSQTCVLNGSIYIIDKKKLIAERSLIYSSTIGYLMPNSRSVDVDTEFDFFFAEYILYNSSKNMD